MTDLPKQNRLPKAARISGKKDIERILSSGRYGFAPGMKYSFADNNGLSYNRVLISVSKRWFKRAVKRNLLKRRIREAFRTQQSASGLAGVDVFFIYNTKEVLSSAQVAEAVNTVLTEIAARIEHHKPSE